jgi:hypothetical protein
MAKFTQVHERQWIREPVVGHDIQRCIEAEVDECTVLIIKSEPNVQYQIDEAGSRRT